MVSVLQLNAFSCPDKLSMMLIGSDLGSDLLVYYQNDVVYLLLLGFQNQYILYDFELEMVIVSERNLYE